MAEKQEKEEQKDKKIESYGQVLLGEDEHNGKIQLMTIIGEIEGHADNIIYIKGLKRG